jgi:membrane protease subunit HflC
MKTILIAVVSLIVGLVLLSCLYVVRETDQVFITEFGKPVGEPINADPSKNQAGLHFKLPVIQQVNRIEKRIMQWDGPDIEMPTRDKLYITVDTFARWRITNPRLYFEKLRDERSALSRLDDIIGGETRTVVAGHDLIEIVRSDKDRVPARDEAMAEAGRNIGALPPIRHGRRKLADQILQAARPKVEDLGIELLDVRFKRINYKSDVIEKIYSRMRSERQQIAERFRSEGAGEAAKIIGRKERDLLEIESAAYRKEQEVRGKADAEATGIYARAYNTSPAAAEFYTFIKTLDTYEKSLGEKTTTILSSDSSLFRLFKTIEREDTKPVGE